MKELLIRVGSVLGKRNSRRRKQRFLKYFGDKFATMKYTVKIKNGKEKHPSQNLVAGDIHTASTIFIAGYDTSTISLIPFHKYYPLNSERNAKNELINVAIKVILSVLLIVMDILMINKLPFFSGSTTYKVTLYTLTVIIIYFVLNGVASSYNFNRNTASIVLLYKIAEELKNNKTVAFVLGDATALSIAGYKYISDILGDEAKKKNVIILDCLAEGENLYLIHKRNTTYAAESIIAYSKGLDIADYLIDEDAAEKSPLYYFPRGMYLISGSLKDEEFQVYNTRGFKDYEVDVERLEKIKDTLKKYISRSNLRVKDPELKEAE